MPRATSSTNVIATIGIDTRKNTFHVIGLDRRRAGREYAKSITSLTIRIASGSVMG
jgi:hypothetical protein